MFKERSDGWYEGLRVKLVVILMVMNVAALLLTATELSNRRERSASSATERDR
jgi:hypothetical protein